MVGARKAVIQSMPVTDRRSRPHGAVSDRKNGESDVGQDRTRPYQLLARFHASAAKFVVRRVLRARRFALAARLRTRRRDMLQVRGVLDGELPRELILEHLALEEGAQEVEPQDVVGELSEFGGKGAGEVSPRLDVRDFVGAVPAALPAFLPQDTRLLDARLDGACARCEMGRTRGELRAAVERRYAHRGVRFFLRKPEARGVELRPARGHWRCLARVRFRTRAQEALWLSRSRSVGT